MSSGIIPRFLCHLLTLHECKVVIQVLSQNKTHNEVRFLKQIIPHLDALNISMVIQDHSDMSFETSQFGKACLVSFSQKALDQVSFSKRRKRPVKILLASITSHKFPKADYQPAVIEYAPVVNLKQLSHSPGKLNT